MFAKINNVAYIIRKNIDLRNFLLETDVKMTMRALQENLQSVRFSIFQKTDKERKNQNRNENKIYILYDKNEKNYYYDDSFIYLNFKKYYNVNRKKYKAKSKQIVEKALFQRICNVLLKTKE